MIFHEERGWRCKRRELTAGIPLILFIQILRESFGSNHSHHYNSPIRFPNTKDEFK